MPVTIFEAVLGNVAVAASLAAVALAAGRWANRPALTHALWLLVLVKLVTPPLVTIPIHCLPAKPEPIAEAIVQASPNPAPAGDVSPVVIVEPTGPQPAAPDVGAKPQAAAAVTEVAGPTEPTRGFVPTATWVPSWDVALLGVWAAGAMISLAVAARRARRFSRLLRFASAAPQALVEEAAAMAERMGLRRAPRVRVVPGGIAPLVWAVGRPTLYFPAGLLARLSAEQRLSLIGHELAHLRRWDHVVRVVEFLAVAVYWWCPLAWLARRELRRLEEEACDADVVASVPGSGFAYASAILETIDYLAGVAPAPALASGIGDAVSLRRRLVLILGTTRPARTSFRARLVLVVGGFGLLVVGPELHRLSAAAKAVIESTSEAPKRPAGFPVVGDEPFVEAVQFLPTPTRLVEANAGNPALGSALSPDGTRLAVAVGSDVIVWDLASKEQLFRLSGHAGAINAVAYSPDGSRIATASNDTTAIIWDAANGRRLHTLTGHGRWVLAAAFSPDGRTLATGGYDKTVRLWGVKTGALDATWTGHAGGVRSVAFSPDGLTLATGGADAEVRLWDVAGGVTMLTLKKHEASVRVVCFSPDGTRLASGSEDRTVRLWNPADGREVGPPIALPDFVTGLGFSRRGHVLLAGTAGGHLLNINPVTGQVRGYVGVEPGEPAGNPAHAAGVTAIFPAPDGKTICTVSQNGSALAWMSAGPPQAARLNFRTSQGMTAVALSPDGLTLATGGQDGVVHLWEAASARELARLPAHPGGVSALMFGAGGQLVSAGLDERVRVWDTRSGQATHTVIQPTAELCIAISPDGRTLAIGGRKLPGITLLNLAASGKPRRFAEWAGEVSALAFNPAGDRIASGYGDGVFRIWDRTTGEEVVRGRAGVGSVDGISFDPAGAVAAVVVNGAAAGDAEAASGPTHGVVFLDTRDGTESEDLRSLPHPGPVTAAAFADGRVLTAAHDGNLYVWNPATGRVVRTIRGHQDAVRGVALTADGTAVFSAGGRAAKMWPMSKEKK